MSSLSDGELLGKNSLLGLLAVCVGAGAVYLVEKKKEERKLIKLGKMVIKMDVKMAKILL